MNSKAKNTYRRGGRKTPTKSMKNNTTIPLASRLFTPSSDPPTIKVNVWTPRVKRITLALGATASTVSVDDLGTGLEVRLSQVKAWIDPGLGGLTMSFYDPTLGTVFQTITDSGSYSTRSRAGITYGANIFNTVINTSASTNNVVSIDSPTSGNAIVDIHFLQRVG